MEIVVCKDYNDMSLRAAEMAAGIMKGKARFVLGLATGSTPVGMYRRWAELNQAGQLDFSNVTTFNLDEYIGLPPEHDQSFAYFMFDNLFNHVNIDKNRVHIPCGMAEDYDAYCRKYEEMIREAGGIDLQILGIGSNGHIGFNEPADTFSENTHTVDLTESTIRDNSRFFASADLVPRRAVTMGIGTILRTRRIIMVVSGANKAAALKAMKEGPETPAMPASALIRHPDVTVFADADAAALL